nr:PREDICTED: uncharacterized protein LOC109032668 [Bemisia tabaci]
MVAPGAEPGGRRVRCGSRASARALWRHEKEADAGFVSDVGLGLGRPMGKLNLGAGSIVVCFLIGFVLGLAKRASRSVEPRSAVVLLYHEQCSQQPRSHFNLSEILAAEMKDVQFRKVPKSEMCNSTSSRAAAFLNAVKDPKTRVIVGSLDSPLCGLARSFTELHNVSFVTWSCPEMSSDSPNLVSILPPKRVIMSAIVNAISTIRWKSVSIITNSGNLNFPVTRNSILYVSHIAPYNGFGWLLNPSTVPLGFEGAHIASMRLDSERVRYAK